MNCPNCKTEVVCKGKLGDPQDPRTWYMCSKNCYFLVMNEDKVLHYEITLSSHKLIGWDVPGTHETIIKSLTRRKNNSLFPPCISGNSNANDDEIYMETIFSISYCYHWQTQEELDSLIPKLLKLKAFA